MKADEREPGKTIINDPTNMGNPLLIHELAEKHCGADKWQSVVQWLSNLLEEGIIHDIIYKSLAACGVPVGIEDCSLCFGEIECPDHLLLKCPYATIVWSRICDWGGWPEALGDSIREWLDQTNNLDNSEETKDTASLIVGRRYGGED
ncbi:hypothetical protein QVD17_34344 [Tagetes erecta]|uniref:Reverse transcriptase zinc-binding domain-containing protein n=1 Tax=Tagetes erecta TaxID=13708 RepID=A0AAD8NLU9_TARER|nr:hypothetical protein QVD17_34344 [Tagetes erecta]